VKVCLDCGSRYDSPDWICPSCHAVPTRRDGFPVFGVSADDTGVATRDAPYLDSQIRTAETRHFWFGARLRLVQWMVHRYFPAARQLLDLGCGTGFVLEGLRRGAPSLALAGCDTRIETLAIARHRLPDVPFFAADVATLPFESEFDLVTALDVLEHIDDDAGALEALLKVIRPGGGLLLTVPQHPWLWSAVDEFSCHRRRYISADLERKITAAGFEIVRCTSCFAVTLPLLAFSRLLHRPRQAFDPAAELQLPAAVNRILGILLAGEGRLIKAGAWLPFGSSLIAVARRPS
jgi:SAM-dependent methyltransferase